VNTDPPGGVCVAMSGRRALPIRPSARLPWAATALLVALLALAAVVDSWRCAVGLRLDGGTTRIAWLVAAGAAAALVCVITALGALRGQEWALWSAAFIGIASAPQAAATGFHPPYAAPDSATLALGLLLLVTVLTGVGVADAARFGDDCATRGGAFDFGGTPLLGRDPAERQRDHGRDAGRHDRQHRQ